MRDWRYREEDVAPSLEDDHWEVARGCFLRTLGWSVLAGAAFGPSYLMLGAVLFLAPEQPAILISGWLWGFMLWSVELGAVASLVVGIVTGLVLIGVVVLNGLLGYPARRVRVALGGVATATTSITYWGLRHVIDGYSLPPWEPGIIPLSYVVKALVFFFLQLVGVGIAGWWVGSRVAKWYSLYIPGIKQE